MNTKVNGVRAALLCAAVSLATLLPMHAWPAPRLHSSASGETEFDDEGGPGAAAQAKFEARAYPAGYIPSDAHDIARATFRSVASAATLGGAWEMIGPQQARYPGSNTYTGKEYVASGRITAIAIAPDCSPNQCRLWIAAAGGGVWRTDRALDHTPKWSFVSGTFDTNAIGSLVLDPSDRSGNTLYAGTGEPNSSADSAAGVGIYKTTDGGETWTLLPGSKNATNGRAVGAIAVNPTNPLELWIGTDRAIRGVSSVTGGGVTLNPGYPGWGLWHSTDGGSTFIPVATTSSTNDTAASTAFVGTRGVTNIELDPADPATVYFSAYGRGLFRISQRLDGAAGIVRVWAAPTRSGSDRTAFSLTTKMGKTRVYVANGGGVSGKVFRTDDADKPVASVIFRSLTSNSLASPLYATFDFCTGQCWYDIAIYSPRGYPDMVYVLGSFGYDEYAGMSNGRAVLVSTTAGEPDPANGERTFTDATWAATPRLQPDGIHPDQHAIVTHPDNPNLFFEGSDGGIVRSDGNWADVSDQCAFRNMGATAVDDRRAQCRRLLSRVPKSLINMNSGLTTLQFQSLSASRQKPLQLLLGGTQDNGTFDYNGSSAVWSQSVGGDGGGSGFDAVNDKTRFHTYYGPYIDVNFNGADPKGWSWISDTFILFPENWNFYVPIIADAVVGGSIFVGQQHVWRTQRSGGDRQTLETWCSETQPPPANPKVPPPDLCGDFEPLGGAYGANAGDLTSIAYGTSKLSSFGYIAAVARSGGDTGTLWAATNAGRIFISRNADATPGTAVTFTRVDSPATPARFVTGIVIDPANPNHAWVSYSGYNATSPIPGHVFEVTYNPGTGTASFNNLTIEGLTGDLPVNGVARDDVTGDLYAATDFGVLVRSAGAWSLAGTGLPMVEVAGLTIDSSARVLYAATHGRSAYRLMLR